MEQLMQIVIKRLKEKGMDRAIVPSFIRDVTNAGFSVDTDLNDLNRRLHALGWSDLDLDDHTFQLIGAINENEAFYKRSDVKLV